MPADLPVPAATALAAAPGRLRRLAGLLPLSDPFALAGIAIYVVFILVAIFAGQIANHDPTQIFYDANFTLAADLAPGGDYILGTTSLTGCRPTTCSCRWWHREP